MTQSVPEEVYSLSAMLVGVSVSLFDFPLACDNFTKKGFTKKLSDFFLHFTLSSPVTALTLEARRNFPRAPGPALLDTSSEKRKPVSFCDFRCLEMIG